jgi:chemotaxis protein methyltransferase CheR
MTMPTAGERREDPARPGPRVTRREREAYAYIIGLVYERSRIRLHEGKESLIRARLGKRMRRLGVEDLGSYCDHLRGPGGEEEQAEAVDALTTNFTSFLREEDHFRFVVDEALPRLLTPGQRRFRLWSAACASGEEAYSLAMYVEERYPLARGWDWRILAADINRQVLARAEAGVYEAGRLEGLPGAWLRKHFQRGVGTATGLYRVRPALRERVVYRRLNLLACAGMAERFEVILCRNVMIYFDRATQQQLVRRLAESLVPGGYLLVGHSESLTGLAVPFRCLRPSYYQKH